MIKQVIVMRKDLGMRKGKMIAQGSHASMKVIIDLMEVFDKQPRCIDLILHTTEEEPLRKWLKGLFTKIVVSVDSEAELLKIYTQAKSAGILCSLILDSGLTEFDGKQTYTCCAIGPDESERIDPITGELPLL